MPCGDRQRGLVTSRQVTRPAGFVSIFAGRRRLAVLHPTDAARLGLLGGEELTPALLAAISEAASITAARRSAMKIVARRELSAAALRDRLGKAGHGEAAAAEAAHWLASLGAVDDRRLAERAAAAELARGKSARLVRRAVTARGVDAAVAAESVANQMYGTGESDVAIALRFARSRLRPALLSLPPAAKRRRLAGQLARRGHDEHTIEIVLDEVLGPADEDE